MTAHPRNHTLTPYIVVKSGKDAIDFYCKAFDAKVLEHHDIEDDKVMHAHLQIGNSFLMLSDEFPEPMGCGMQAPTSGKTPFVLHMYTDNVDAVFDKAIKCGAKVVMPVEDQFWGDRYGQLEDPFGHRWSIATPLRDH